MAEDKILVIEDDQAVSSLITDMLQHEGFKITAAGNVRTAQEYLKREHPAMIILDRMLPDFDGLALCAVIRQTPEFKQMPILVLSALNSSADKVTGFKIGCDDYLGKPFTSAELLARVESLIRRGRQPEVKPGPEAIQQKETPPLPPAEPLPIVEFVERPEGNKASLQGLREQLDRWQNLFHTKEPETALRTSRSSGRSILAKRLGVVAASLSLIALIAALWLYWGSGKDYALPFSHPSGLVWSKGTLWVSDWYDQAVYQLRQDGGTFSVIRRYALPKSHLSGLALVDDSLYVTDSESRQIQRWRIREEQLVLEASWPSPGGSPAAVYFDGKDLWTSDKQTHTVYRHGLDEKLTILNTYPIQHSPAGFYADNAHFWSADESGRLVYRHRWDPSLSILTAYRLPVLDKGISPLSCFTVYDNRVWLGQDGSNILIQRSWWRFKSRNLQ